MSIRVKHIVQLQLSEDTDGTKRLFWRDTTPSTVVIDTFSKSINQVISVAVSSTDTLSLGDLTSVKGMYLEVSADAKLRLNGSSNSIDLRAQNGTAKFFIESDITQVELENESADTVLTGVYVMWGD